MRAPGRRGTWSQQEVAHALNERRVELRRALDRRQDARGFPPGIRGEILDEAIGVVVMSRKPIRNEQHLQGAFWTSIRFLLAEHRARRHELRVGSRRRVDLDRVTARLPDGDGPLDLVASRERLARAADFMAQLDPFEQRVVALMATRGLGVKLTAKALGKPTRNVLAAARSADRKLEQVATIASAGRMCDYRMPAILAHAQGDALAHQELAAKAHLAACAGCRRSLALLVREMRSREFRGAASALVLPAPVAVAEAHGLVERLVIFVSNGPVPSGSGATGERAAGLLGGGGLVKAAAVSTALVVAGAGVGARVIHSLDSAHPARRHPATQHTPSATRDLARPVAIATATGSATSQTASGPGVARRDAGPRKAAPRTAPPPSRDLGYLAVGESAADSSPPPRASAASTVSRRASTGEEESPPPHPTSSGGGTSLSYLGQ